MVCLREISGRLLPTPNLYSNRTENIRTHYSIPNFFLEQFFRQQTSPRATETWGQRALGGAFGVSKGGGNGLGGDLEAGAQVVGSTNEKLQLMQRKILHISTQA